MLTSATRAPLVGSNGDELRSLLAPITPAEFVHEYWAKKPLFVKGFKDKYTGFFDAETFSRALAPGPAPDDFLRASFDLKTAAGRSAPVQTSTASRSSAFRATLDQAVPLFDAGATLCISQIETRVPALVPFLAAIKRQLGYPGRVCFNAYLSPPGAGFNWHFDSRIASTLQIEGTKRWRFSKQPAVAWPRSNGTLRADGTAHYTESASDAREWDRLTALDEDDVLDALLEPGDLLILPAGVWHEACGGTTGSLALNLSFSPISYTLLIRNLLDTLLAGEAGWRSPAPLLPTGDYGEVDPVGIAAIATELQRAATALAALRGDSAEVIRLWQTFVQHSTPGLAPAQPLSVVATRISPTKRLRIRDDGNVYALLADGGSRLCLSVGSGHSIELTGATVRFVQRMLVERAFVASDCLAWSADGGPLTWSDVEYVLTKLQAEGLIEEAP